MFGEVVLACVVFVVVVLCLRVCWFAVMCVVPFV